MAFTTFSLLLVVAIFSLPAFNAQTTCQPDFMPTPDGCCHQMKADAPESCKDKDMSTHPSMPSNPATGLTETVAGAVKTGTGAVTGLVGNLLPMDGGSGASTMAPAMPMAPDMKCDECACMYCPEKSS